MGAAVGAAMASWHDGKLFIEESLPVGHDSLHVMVGVLLWLVVGLVTRWPLSARGPWLCLLAVILWNESVDLFSARWPHPDGQYGEGAKDVLITMLVPSALLFAIRVRPDLFRTSLRKGRK
jgi:hypothetical protein